MQSLVPASIFTGIFVVEQRDSGAHKQLGWQAACMPNMLPKIMEHSNDLK
jgi:hypothetical protein